jgi:hypothetical protein
MSSLRICRDVAALDDSVVDEFLEFIRREKRNEFFREFYSIASFFKHADRDPGSLLDFPPDLPEFNEVLILLVGWTFQKAFEVPSRNFILHLAILIQMAQEGRVGVALCAFFGTLVLRQLWADQCARRSGAF